MPFGVVSYHAKYFFKIPPLTSAQHVLKFDNCNKNCRIYTNKNKFNKCNKLIVIVFKHFIMTYLITMHIKINKMNVCQQLILKKT